MNGMIELLRKGTFIDGMTARESAKKISFLRHLKRLRCALAVIFSGDLVCVI